MNTLTLTRQQDGSWQSEGTVRTKYVRVHILRADGWDLGRNLAPLLRERALAILEEIRFGRAPAKYAAYRLAEEAARPENPEEAEARKALLRERLEKARAVRKAKIAQRYAAERADDAQASQELATQTGWNSQDEK